MPEKRDLIVLQLPLWSTMGITSTHWLYYWVEQGTRIPAVLIHFVMPLSLKETKWVPAGESKETWKAPLDEWECHNCPPPIFGDYKTLLNHGPLDIDWERAKQKPTIAAWIREQRFYQWAMHAAQLSSPFAVVFFFLSPFLYYLLLFKPLYKKVTQLCQLCQLQTAGSCTCSTKIHLPDYSKK